MKDKYKKVEVTWDDAFHLTESWTSVEEIAEAYKEQRFRVTNIGWLLFENKDYIILGAKRAENWESFGATIMVPKPIIKKMKNL